MLVARDPQGALAGQSYGWSVAVHAVALGAALAWQAWPLASDSASFTGREGLVVLDASFAAAEVEPALSIVVDVAQPMPPRTEPLQPMSTAQSRLVPSEIASESHSDPVLEIVATGKLPPIAASVGQFEDSPADRPAETPAQPHTQAALARAVARPRTIASLAALAELPGVQSDSAARWAVNPPPVYPPLALAQGWHGTALLRVWIAASGRIEKVEIEHSSGFEILDEAAILAVQRWRAQPATRLGVAMASVELQAIVFLPRRL